MVAFVNFKPFLLLKVRFLATQEEMERSNLEVGSVVYVMQNGALYVHVEGGWKKLAIAEE